MLLSDSSRLLAVRGESREKLVTALLGKHGNPPPGILNEYACKSKELVRAD